MKQQFIRNLGIMSEEEVAKLHDCRIAIAGCGCIGGFAAELLTRMGVGRLVLADPDTFDISNINRQCAATHLTLGQPKVEALKSHLISIHPELELTIYSEGVHPGNVDEFVENADYVVDAIDYFAFADSVMLHRAARKSGIPVMTAAALGFGATVLTFLPDGMSLEQYVGVPESITYDELKSLSFPPSGYSAELPAYATTENVRRWIEERTIPTISVGQALGPGLLVSQLVLHLLGRKQPVQAPRSIQIQFESTTFCLL